MENWYLFISYEIEFLLNLPRLIREKREKLFNLDDDIPQPTMQIKETGELTIVGASTENEGIRLAEMREAVQKEIERSIARGRRLVQAIKQLLPEEQHVLFTSYMSSDNPAYASVCDKLLHMYERQRMNKEEETGKRHRQELRKEIAGTKARERSVNHPLRERLIL